MGEGRIKRISYGCHYFFVKPGKNGDVHMHAKKLMSIEQVKEVVITEGEYGFIVKTHVLESHSDTVRKINTAVRGTSINIMCHCKYMKR